MLRLLALGWFVPLTAIVVTFLVVVSGRIDAQSRRIITTSMEKAADIRGEVTEIGWGNQIRSYVLQPYKMVKDLRTGAESGNPDKILDGDIDYFIMQYLKWDSIGRPDRKVSDS